MNRLIQSVNILYLLIVILCCWMMNDKNIEQLQSIAKLLRSKLNLINKNIIKKGVKEGP